ncbi:FCD domain-containing protein [Paenibacillus sp. NPDC057934]|uniref:FCD domain-containing protein n=1 Tax=Paenibacillus sp. NPDC057934 TaxID=3346282 RepID=UPI0036DA2707
MSSFEWTSLQLEHELLSTISLVGEPVGASTLVHTVGKKYELSQATIGRKLMELDMKGYVQLEGRKGRILTEKGANRLSQLEKRIHQETLNSRLLEVLNVSGQKAMINVLVARRALEREIASLAAQRATPDHIELLRNSIQEQLEVLSENQIPYEGDREFHHLLALIARNDILMHAVQLVWDRSRELPATAFIRNSVGSKLVVDHQRIVDAIAEGSPEKAEQAMVDHINQMIEDVKRYYQLKQDSQSL